MIPPRRGGPSRAKREPGWGRPAGCPPPSGASRLSLPAPGKGKLVLLGEFGRAHGLGGEVRLKSHTADPLAIAGYGPLLAGEGRQVTLAAARRAAGDQPDMLVVRVEGVATREAAEALNRLPVRIARERLGEPDPEEFYLADLVGLAVEDAAGPVGRVVAVPDYGGGELLEIALAGGGSRLLLPFTRAFVPEVDVAAGRIRIEPPAGWADEEPG